MGNRNGYNWYKNRVGTVFTINGNGPDIFGIYRINAKIHGKEFVGKGVYTYDCKVIDDDTFKIDDRLFEI